MSTTPARSQTQLIWPKSEPTTVSPSNELITSDDIQLKPGTNFVESAMPVREPQLENDRLIAEIGQILYHIQAAYTPGGDRLFSHKCVLNLVTNHGPSIVEVYIIKYVGNIINLLGRVNGKTQGVLIYSNKNMPTAPSEVN